MMFKLAIIKTYLKKYTLIKLQASSLTRGLIVGKKHSWQLLQGYRSSFVLRRSF